MVMFVDQRVGVDHCWSIPTCVRCWSLLIHPHLCNGSRVIALGSLPCLKTGGSRPSFVLVLDHMRSGWWLQSYLSPSRGPWGPFRKPVTKGSDQMIVTCCYYCIWLIRLALPACKRKKRQLNDMKSMKHMKSLADEKEIIPANRIDSRNHRWIYSFWGQRRTSCRKVRNDNLQRVIPCLLGARRLSVTPWLVGDFWPIMVPITMGYIVGFVWKIGAQRPKFFRHFSPGVCQAHDVCMYIYIYICIYIYIPLFSCGINHIRYAII